MSHKPHTQDTPAPRPDDETNGFGVLLPFAKFLGVHVTEQSPQRSQLRIDPRPELLNSWGAMTGGVVMAMLDFAMAAAVRGQVGHNVSVATLDISLAFLNACRGEFVVEGRVLQATKTAYFCEAEAKGPDGTLFAKSIGTFKPLTPKSS